MFQERGLINFFPIITIVLPQKVQKNERLPKTQLYSAKSRIAAYLQTGLFNRLEN